MQHLFEQVNQTVWSLRCIETTPVMIKNGRHKRLFFHFFKAPAAHVVRKYTYPMRALYEAKTIIWFVFLMSHTDFGAFFYSSALFLQGVGLNKHDRKKKTHITSWSLGYINSLHYYKMSNTLWNSNKVSGKRRAVLVCKTEGNKRRAAIPGITGDFRMVQTFLTV